MMADFRRRAAGRLHRAAADPACGAAACVHALPRCVILTFSQ